ncbi:bifunctional diguanylate cyclase/phosphodiesterase [uncultured Azohydromonas sp.]|jgi:PAS domain S-box/diguanylate cyclase (GGDEF) domain|uniref:sensor domain-containing protein n=1 Tax=uncultured Azohydromonas sp. TaxID=487342 RepID=UPI0026254AF2|nr:bifunctional diguanylate cyclase/phosphodiesterase [uncultured Azohydromonas sp.]
MAHTISDALMGDKGSTPAIHSLEALLANIHGMVYRCLADTAWTMEFVSQGAFELTGHLPSELLGQHAIPFDQLIHPEDREHVRQVVQDAVDHGRRYELEYRIRRKDGVLRWVVERGSAVKYVDKGLAILEGIIQDVTDRKKSNENLLEAERRYRSIFENAIEGIYQSTMAQGYLDVNPALARIYGYDSPSQLIEGLRDIGSQLYVDLNRRLEFMQIMDKHGIVSNFESRVYRRDGSVIWISENARAVRNEAGEVLFYEGTVEDITQRKLSEAEIHFRATHDPLTRLANRTLLEERLEQAIDGARRNGKCVAVVFLDLDKFKYINDSLGHQLGDELLVTIADRLRHCVRESDTVARLGGDEFVLVLVNQINEKTVEKTVQRILSDVARPWVANGVEIQVTCSMGVSLFPAHGCDSAALLKHADAAMFEAKRLGRNNSQYFSENLDDAAVNRLETISSLRHALKNHEFQLHYQPKCDLATGAVVGAEALIRWQRPGRPVVGPNVFLPLAEDAGLMEAIGEWVLHTACLQNRKWQDAGLPPISVSVNVSPLQLEKDSLLPQITHALRESGLAPRYLEIEVTENGMMRHIERSMQTLRRLKDLGVRLSIDDFGTGYSSLSHLKSLPMDTLKIDKSFIRNISSDHQNASIVKAVISLGHSLGLKVVAEGVETESEYRHLQLIGCNEMQGYYRGRPVPAQSFSMAYLQAPTHAMPAA